MLHNFFHYDHSNTILTIHLVFDGYFIREYRKYSILFAIFIIWEYSNLT